MEIWLHDKKMLENIETHLTKLFNKFNTFSSATSRTTFSGKLTRLRFRLKIFFVAFVEQRYQIFESHQLAKKVISIKITTFLIRRGEVFMYNYFCFCFSFDSSQNKASKMLQIRSLDCRNMTCELRAIVPNRRTNKM